MPQSNARFVVYWAALVPVLTGAALLVSPLGVAHWSEIQTGLTVAEVNAISALVLGAFAYFWAHSTKEPAVVAGALAANVLATVALGNGFAWWNLTDATGQLVVSFAGAVLILAITIFVRAKVTPVESMPVLDVDSTVTGTAHDGPRKGDPTVALTVPDDTDQPALA